MFPRKNNSDLLITRKKQDNGFIENKNKYIETACFDNPEIIEAFKTEFIEKLQDYIDINNYYLEGSNKYVYRGEWVTPKKNLIERFWKEKTDIFLSYLGVTYMEGKYKIKNDNQNKSLFELLDMIYPHLHLDENNNLLFKSMHPKSLDSSFLVFLKNTHNNLCYKCLYFFQEMNKNNFILLSLILQDSLVYLLPC